ncbi:MAG: phosphoribosylformylglycinamidine synthase subunit PurS [Candidatus Lokiarchaeota archaeon]|nr:phosphoribosylformylglycinamidine synthase subunit PurS [Candidatus Lokiarchaeota archaeon]MBD3201476.1 phosphoribosylformylglycinamidine synthase subunit PurS [Candidatus Lokiarchaeota archaeon]
MGLKDFIVEIVLQNKEKAKDPVGATIQRDLIAKKGYANISNVRSGQYLRISVEANDKEEAKQNVVDMANDLRIFNPVTQNLTILNVTVKS